MKNKFMNIGGIIGAICVFTGIIMGTFWGFTFTPIFGYIALVTFSYFWIFMGITIVWEKKDPERFKIKCVECDNEIGDWVHPTLCKICWDKTVENEIKALQKNQKVNT